MITVTMGIIHAMKENFGWKVRGLTRPRRGNTQPFLYLLAEISGKYPCAIMPIMYDGSTFERLILVCALLVNGKRGLVGVGVEVE